MNGEGSMKKFVKWGLISIAVLVLISFGAFYVWSQMTYGPSDELLEQVDVESILVDGDVIIRADGESKGGIILYPGAKVENTAYSYYGKSLAESGYDVFIPSFTLNFALFNTNISSIIMKNNTEITKWYVGGHSLGGVAAAMFAKKHPELVEGVIFLASYPNEGSNLAESDLKVLSLYAELDGLTQLRDIEASKALLPEHTHFVEIAGGNHAQFGMYGEQPGDFRAKISTMEQQHQLINETIDWLENNA